MSVIGAKIPTNVKEINSTLKQNKKDENHSKIAESLSNSTFFSVTRDYANFEKAAKKLPDETKEAALNNKAMGARAKIEEYEKNYGTNRNMEQLSTQQVKGADGYHALGVQYKYMLKTQKAFKKIAQVSGVASLVTGMGAIFQAALDNSLKTMPDLIEVPLTILQLPSAWIGYFSSNQTLNYFASTIVGSLELGIGIGIAYFITSKRLNKVRNLMGRAFQSIRDRTMTPQEKEIKELRQNLESASNQSYANDTRRSNEQYSLKDQNYNRIYKRNNELETLKNQNNYTNQSRRDYELQTLKNQNDNNQYRRNNEMQSLTYKTGVTEAEKNNLKEKHKNAKEADNQAVENLKLSHQKAKKADEDAVIALANKHKLAKDSDDNALKALKQKHEDEKKQEQEGIKSLEAKLKGMLQ